MLVFNRPAELSGHLQNAQKGTIGFVPTMGALHDGHLSLLNFSLSQNDLTVISIFVNPTQFNNADDLAHYPRTLQADLDKIEKLNKDIIVFAPNVKDMYGDAAKADKYRFGGLENEMEGRFRQGPFNGVATIVRRLFEIVNPTRAYCGDKDFQQLQIVRSLVERHNLPVQIVGCPIYREQNGLAMSSRNERLTADQRSRASVIYRALQRAQAGFLTESTQKIRHVVGQMIASEPGFTLEYFEVADEKTLRPAVRKSKKKKYRAFIAVLVNNVRLIDTIALN